MGEQLPHGIKFNLSNSQKCIIKRIPTTLRNEKRLIIFF